MKRIVILTLLLVGVINLKAYDFQIDNLYYTVTNATTFTCAVDEGNEVYEGEIVIPSTVTYKNKELKVTSIKNSAFRNSNITSIQLSHNMTMIERFAFYNCGLLQKVTIPSSVNKIGESSFDNCGSLYSLIIEDGLSELEFDKSSHNPFFSNSPIEELYLGRNIVAFISTQYNSLFGDLSNLTKITIGESVESIPSYCFAGASSLRTISLPGNIKIVQKGAFNNCINLKYVEFCDGNTPIKMYHSTIGSHEYSGGTVNYSIFAQSPIQEVYIGRNFSENSYYYWPQDITFEYLPITKVTIGKNVSELTSFDGCRDLQSIEIPENVQVIKSFRGCTGLRNVVVHNTNPPTCGRFSEETYVHGTLFVPSQSIVQYSETTPWSSFWEIKDLSNASIDFITFDYGFVGPVYSISGTVLSSNCAYEDLQRLPKGIYIWQNKKFIIR